MIVCTNAFKESINTLNIVILNPAAAITVNNAEDITHFASGLSDFSLLPLYLDLFGLQIFFI